MHTQVVISTDTPRGGLLGSQEELNDPVTSGHTSEGQDVHQKVRTYIRRSGPTSEGQDLHQKVRTSTQVVISTDAPRGGLLGSQEELNDSVTS